MKKKIKSVIALGMALTMTIMGIYVYDSPNRKAYAKEAMVQAEETLTDTLKESVSQKSLAGADREETVYIVTDANGKIQNQISSVWLKNKDGSNELEDVANLREIVNVKGDEKYTEGENGKITWNSNGSDIYYQGNSDAKLPVNVKIIYLLDGKEISPEELAGKSGKVTIRFEYTGNETTEVKINGKKEKIVTPFLMVSGMVLPTDKFTNIQVDNGKVISDGNRAIVVGIGFPGLNDDLSLSLLSKDMDAVFPESFEVTADVKDFSLLMTMTMGTSDIFENINVNKEADANELDSMLDTISASLTQLSNGSGQLSDGIKELNKNMKLFKSSADKFEKGVREYTKYVDQFSNGATKLADATKELNDQIPTMVSGINDINKGMSLMRLKISEDKKNTTLLAGATQVSGGIKKLYKSMDDMYNAVGENITTYSKNIAELTKGIQDAKQNLKNAEDGVKAYKDGIASLKQAAEDYVTAGDVTSGLGYYKKLTETYEQLTAVYDQMIVGYDKLLTFEEQLGQCQGAVSALTNIKGQMDKGKLIANLKALKDGSRAVQDGVQELADSVNKELAPGVRKLAEGTKKLPDGIKELNEYMKQLSGGLSQVSAKSKELRDGAQAITNAGIQFLDGIEKLSDGSGKLETGINQFKTETVDKVSGALGSEVDILLKRADATIKAAKEYTSFSGLAEGKEGTVKFIYRSEEIK